MTTAPDPLAMERRSPEPTEDERKAARAWEDARCLDLGSDISGVPESELREYCVGSIDGFAACLASTRSPDEARDPGERTDKDLLGWVVGHAGNRASDGPKSRWGYVADLLGLGSHSAIAICKRFGVDPDEQVGLDSLGKDESGGG